MKKLFMLVALCFTMAANAQGDCKYSVAPTKENNGLKTTTEYLMHEMVFGGTSTYIFFSLTNTEGIPLLNFQLLSKSKDFPEPHCLDKSSKIYLQLRNGKIVTLISALDEKCSELIYDDTEKNNIGVLTGTFLFTKGTLEDLEKSPITMMRIRYVTGTVDYPAKKELVSETTKEIYSPESYFVIYLKCIK